MPASALRRGAELEERISSRWSELGLDDLGGAEPDPSLFGLQLEQVLERLVTARS